MFFTIILDYFHVVAFNIVLISYKVINPDLLWLTVLKTIFISYNLSNPRIELKSATNYLKLILLSLFRSKKLNKSSIYCSWDSRALLNYK
jgi:hypothetical protein